MIVNTHFQPKNLACDVVMFVNKVVNLCKLSSDIEASHREVRQLHADQAYL